MKEKEESETRPVRIPAGLIRMSNGQDAVAYVDTDYLLGPEAAHINVSGISGLATKTSYITFLVQSTMSSSCLQMCQDHYFSCSFSLRWIPPMEPGCITGSFVRSRWRARSRRMNGWMEYFDILLAHLYVRWTEKILASHVAQTYERQEERLQLLKGKPLWDRNFGRHPAEGIECRYFQLQTDNLFNRLILAGLIKAASVLRRTQFDERVQNQLFIWRSLAKVAVPRPDMFWLAYTKLTRLTDHYGPVLRLGEALLFGHAPRELFGSGSEWLQGFYFDVPRLYENFLAYLLRHTLAPYGFKVKEQFAQHGAFVDANDRRYRNVQPDIVIFKGAIPVAIIDAKYKRQYVEGWTGGGLLPRNKVSNEDLYQMFFYQARLKYRYKLTRSIASALIAPQLPGASECPPVEYRAIRWKASEGHDEHALWLLPLPLEPVLEAMSSGLDPSQALSHAPEIPQFLKTLIDAQ
jgi:hypothetical protein